MPLQLSGVNISTPDGDSGTYTWSDVTALGSTGLTNTAESWTLDNAYILLRGNSTLTISHQNIRVLGSAFIHATDASAIVFDRCSLFLNCNYTNNNPTDSSGSGLSYVRGQDDCKLILQNSSVFLSPASGVRRNLFLSEVLSSTVIANSRGYLSSETPPTGNWYDYGVFVYLQDNGLIENSTFQRIRSIEFDSGEPTSLNGVLFDECMIPFNNYDSYSLVRVKNYKEIGSAAPYQTQDGALEFINSPVDLSQGYISIGSYVSYQTWTHDLRLLEGTAPIEGALIRYFRSGSSISDTTDSLGNVDEFELRVANTSGTEAGTVTVVDTSEWTREIKSYRHIGTIETLIVNSQVGTLEQPFVYSMVSDSGVTQTNTATVSGYLGISHTTSGFTLSGTLTLAQVYDSRKWYWRNNSEVAAPTYSNGVANFGDTNIVINSPASNPATNTKFSQISLSGDLTLASAGNYSATPWDLSGNLTVAGDTIINNWTFSGVTINNSSASNIVVTVAADQIANITIVSPTVGGGSITLQAPQTTVSFNIVFRGSNPPINYEWRLYEDDITPGILGTNELAGNENETELTIEYPHSLAGTNAIFQVIATGFKESITPFVLSSSDQAFNIFVDPDPNL